VKTRANHKEKLAKLIHPMEPILSNNLTVSFEAFGLSVKINAKLHTTKQVRRAAQTLLSKDFLSFHNKKNNKQE